MCDLCTTQLQLHKLFSNTFSKIHRCPSPWRATRQWNELRHLSCWECMMRREWLEVEASWRDDVEGVIVIEALLPEAAQTIRRRTRGLTVLLFETFELSQSRTEKFRKSFIPLLSRKFPIGFMNFNSCLLIYIIFSLFCIIQLMLQY